jgi:hypothetical protein
MNDILVAPTVTPVNDATPMTPTVAEYSGLQVAYDHLNFELLGDELPNVMIVLTRRAHSYGHFAADRFAAREGDDRLHEVSLNPDAFFGRTDKEILSTELHEMIHVLQAVRGTGTKRPYHNRNFAELMKARGLYPSNTGAVGGRETGAQMSHFIIPGGAFETSYERLRAKGWKLGLQSAIVAGPRGGKQKNKTAFVCACGAAAWGKRSLFMVCGPCLVENHPELIDIAETYRMTESQASANVTEPAEPEPSDFAQAAE